MVICNNTARVGHQTATFCSATRIPTDLDVVVSEGERGWGCGWVRVRVRVRVGGGGG